MSDYTTEADGSVRARRKRRTLITLAVVLLGLFFAFWYAWSYYQSDLAARATRPPGATCAPYDAKAVTPERTKVNVYNASDRQGLAASVSRALGDRGFDHRQGRQRPQQPQGALGRRGALRLRRAWPRPSSSLTAMPKGTELVNDKRKGATVDVAVGAKFTPPRPGAHRDRAADVPGALRDALISPRSDPRRPR